MFTITTSGLERAIAALSRTPAGLPRAIRSAVRRTLRGAKKDAGTKAAARYLIGAGEVTRTIRLSQSGYNGSMTSSGARNPLKKFKINPRSRPRKMPRSGVYAQVVRGQGGQIFHAFLQRSGSVVERVGKPRFPLRTLRTVAVPQMLSNQHVGPFIEAKMATRLGINLDHELAAAMGGLFG